MHRLARALLVFSVCAAWTLISAAPLWRYLSHGKALMAMALGAASIAVAMRWMARARRAGDCVGLKWFVLLYLAFAAAFIILYPVSLRHTLNQGSDREDALRIELNAVHQGRYPYDGRTYLGHAPTPLPGAMLLAAPFYAAGHIAWQNFLWTALFFVFALRFFRNRSTALFLLTVFLLLAPSDLSDLTSGGDYIINFFYTAIAGVLCFQGLERSMKLRVGTAMFFGLTLSSRVVYVFLAVPLFALALQRTTRSRAGMLVAIVLATWCWVTLPLFAPHPLGRLLQQLSQNSHKLRYLPTGLHPQWTLAVLALAIACSSFLIRMNVSRVFLVFCCSSLAVLAPPVLSIAFVEHRLPYEFSYLAISVLAFLLWALARYEGMTRAAAPAMNVDGSAR